MTHNKFMKAKNIPFEIAGVDYEKEWYSKIRSLCLLELYIALRRRKLASIPLFLCKASPRKSLLNKMSSIQPVFTDQPYVLAITPRLPGICLYYCTFTSFCKCLLPCFSPLLDGVFPQDRNQRIFVFKLLLLNTGPDTKWF